MPALTSKRPQWAQEPPLIEDKQGSWQRAGDVYDAWDDETDTIIIDS